MKSILIVVSLLFASSVFAAKPEKVLICHFGTEIVEIIQIIDGVEEVIEVEIETRKSMSLPEKAANKHIANHGDLLIVENEEGELTPCEAIEDGVDDDEVEGLLLSVVRTAEADEKANCDNRPNDTQADTNHPDIHSKVGKCGGNANANPNGNGNGGQIHGIANNPGQSDNEPGVANLANVHGGIGDVNKNVD